MPNNHVPFDVSKTFPVNKFYFRNWIVKLYLSILDGIRFRVQIFFSIKVNPISL